MAGFGITRFSGIQPVIGPRKLANEMATQAQHCDLEANDIRQFSPEAVISNVASNQALQRSAFVYDESQMFVFPDDVDTTFGPIRSDEAVDDRVFISAGFTDKPVYTTKRIGLPDPDDPYYGPPIGYRTLGVQVPETPPIVSVAQPGNGAGKLIAGNPTVLECVSGPGGIASFGDDLKDGSRVRINGLTDEDWLRINNNLFTIERLDETDADYDKYVILYALNTTDLIAEGDEDGNQIFEGVSSVTYSEQISWTHEYDTAEIEDRIYVYTLVTELGEEGPPSDPSDIVSVGDGQIVTITLPVSFLTDGQAYTAKRLYRTVTASNGVTNYYFVAEIPLAQGTFLDDISAVSLGELLPSEEWYPPDEEMRGLTVLPNGVMAGFYRRELFLSEPYQPHAWPQSYVKTMDSDIVSIAAFGQHLVVGTEENPYIGTATDPRSMTFSKLESVEPCISKRCMKSLGVGVIYPSSNGLIMVTSRGTRNIIDGFFDEKAWRKLFDQWPEQFAVVHDGRYYLTFFDSVSRASQTYVFDPQSQSIELTLLDPSTVSGMAVDRDEDRLYMLAYDNGPRVWEWNPDDPDESAEAVWKSKVYVMPYPVNMGAMQVFFTPTAWGSTTVEFFCDGVSKGVYPVTSQEPMRLASGFMAREWQIKITTTQPIQAVYVMETVSELRGALST
jgi:hypothetical protein